MISRAEQSRPPHPHRMRWAVTDNQVFPVNDLREHCLRDCWCRPTEDDGVFIHHSLDQRELYERGERKPS